MGWRFAQLGRTCRGGVSSRWGHQRSHGLGPAAVTLLAVCALAGGCDRGQQQPRPTTQSDTAVVPAAREQPAPAQPPLPLIAGYESWTIEQVVQRLKDPAGAVSAAIRAVRLSGQWPLCVPDPLPVDYARHLAVVALNEHWWALGLPDEKRRRWRQPVLIAADGSVVCPTGGLEEELSCLYISPDADIFPHLIITPTRVIRIGDQVVRSLAAVRLDGAWFAWEYNDGYPFVSIDVTGNDGQPIEVARYTWDVYEEQFMGPQIEDIPDPPGGRVELDLDQSQDLIPVGGVLPEPEPTPEEEDEPPPQVPPF